MSINWRLIDKNNFLCFWISGTLLALIFSPFFLSVGMIGLAVISLFNWDWSERGIRIFLDRPAIKRLSTWKDRPDIMAFTILFFMILASVWGLSDLDYWLDRLRMKLPFLILPFAFLLLPKLKRASWEFVLYFFVCLTAGTALVVLINYGLNAEAINIAIKKGQAIPTPINHIRFSLISVLASIIAFYLAQLPYHFRGKSQKWLLIGLGTFLILFLHFLSVRTGLLALYASMFVLGFAWIIKTKRYLLSLALVGLMVAAPFAAYQFIPSLKAKIDYVRYDAWKHNRGEGELYADSGRIVSLKAGMQIWQQHLLLGTGAGGLRPAVKDIFEKEYPQYPHPLMPHNQYLYIAAATGILGLLLFITAFYYPLFHRGNYRRPVLLGLYVILFVVFLVEHTIENSMGVGFAALFLFFLLSEPKRE